MKTLTGDLLTHWQGDTTTIAICWRMDLTDGTVMGFTDHSSDIVYDGVTYEAASGFTPTQFEQSADMSVDGMDVEAFLDSASITPGDIAAGRYDKAEIRVFKLNWTDPSMGILKLSRGWIGEVSRQDDLFVAEVRSLTQALQQKIGSEYIGTCDADLGDSRCGVDVGALTVSGTVDSASSQQVFTDTERVEADGYFNYGLLTWTSGANNGRSMEVKSNASGVITLFQAMPDTISAGDTYDVYPGCDKAFSTCKDKFNNVVNFRGYPHIPGKDKVNNIG